jgi:DNA-binding CsgD family transcriptional regulator
VASASQLLERERECTAIEQLLDDASGGRGRVVVFHGPAGIGKSALVRAAVDRGLARDFDVVSARGGELERDSAFGVVRQLFMPPLGRCSEVQLRQLLSGAAARAASVLGIRTPESRAVLDTFAALHGLHALVLNLAAHRPLLLVVDDLQWADGFSQQAIEYLSRRVEGERLALVLGVRVPDPGAELAPVAAILGDSNALSLELAPLTSEGSDRLLASALGADGHAEFVAACREATNGNPYLILELARACSAEHIGPTREGVERVRQLGPASIARAVLVRLADRGEEAQRLVRALSVLESASIMLAADVAELSLDTASRAADALADVNVLAPERPLRFVHPIVRNAILSELGLGEASRLHLRAAQQLARSDHPPESVAAHLQHTDPASDPWVVEALLAGAKAALAGGAPRAAVAYLQRALAESALPARQGELVGTLGYARLAEDDLEAGLGDLQLALKLADPEHRALILTFAALYVPALDADVAETLSLFTQDNAGLRLALEAHRRFDESFDAHVDRLRNYRDLRGTSQGERAMLCLLAASEAYTAAAPATEVVQRARRGLSGSSLVVDLDRFPALAMFEFEMPRWAWEALVMAGRPELVFDEIDAAMETALGMGAPSLVASLHRERAEAHARMGDLPSACAEWRSALDALTAAPQQVGDDTLRLWLAWAEAEQGNHSAARALIREATTVTDEDVFFLESRHIRGTALARLGEFDAAVADLVAGGTQLERLGIRNPAYELPWRAEAAAALAALGRIDEARTIIEPAVEPARRWNAPGPLGRVLHALALTTTDPDERLTRLADAVDVLRGSVQRLDLARVLIDHGAALRRTGRRLDANQRLAEGADLADRCGAVPLVRYAHEEMAATGRRPRRARTSGPGALTPSERRIAERAAAGRTNSQICQELFLSRKTVEMHLGRAYRKLGVTGRHELAGALGTHVQP